METEKGRKWFRKKKSTGDNGGKKKRLCGEGEAEEDDKTKERNQESCKKASSGW